LPRVGQGDQRPSGHLVDGEGSDGLTDVPLDDVIDRFRRNDKIGSLAIHPPINFRNGEHLMLEPFSASSKGHLMDYKYGGFRRAMNALRGRHVLTDMVEHDELPWRGHLHALVRAGCAS
jgi:glucose-1-phosphate cytidylyltransferase